MAFHEIRFPAKLSFGSVGGPERRTEIVALANGFEERNTPWAEARRRYDAGVSLRSLDDIGELIAFFEARQGQLHGFRWKDWTDHKSCLPSGTPNFADQTIGTGDGVQAAFQLVKTYASGGHSQVRRIAKPVAGSVRLALDGGEVTSGWSLDTAIGLVTFEAPPGAGVQLTAGFEFDVPVRFDTDFLEIDLSAFEAGAIPDIPLTEIRL